MYNMEYYGFGLLCRVQQECNSHFETPPDFFDPETIYDVDSPEFRSSLVKHPLDFSGLGYPGCNEGVSKFDLVARFFGGKLTSELVCCIADSCKEAGLSDVLYQISQWTPDRKRSSLFLMKNIDGAPHWVATSLGSYERKRAHDMGGIYKLEMLQRELGAKKVLSDFSIELSDRACSNLCEIFMELARARGLFNRCQD